MFRILFIFLLLPLAGLAQVEIVKDHRIDLLVQKQEEVNKKAYIENNRTAAGYRILVVSTNDRTMAMDVKSRMMRDFPDHKTYLIYQSPHFRIHIGNFKTRPDAENLRKQISKIYPTGVIIIPSTIEVKPEEDLQLAN